MIAIEKALQNCSQPEVWKLIALLIKWQAGLFVKVCHLKA